MKIQRSLLQIESLDDQENPVNQSDSQAGPNHLSESDINDLLWHQGFGGNYIPSSSEESDHGDDDLDSIHSHDGAPDDEDGVEGDMEHHQVFQAVGGRSSPKRRLRRHGFRFRSGKLVTTCSKLLRLLQRPANLVSTPTDRHAG